MGWQSYNKMCVNPFDCCATGFCYVDYGSAYGTLLRSFATWGLCFGALLRGACATELFCAASAAEAVLRGLYYG